MKSKENKTWLRRFNRKITNPLMMALAGRRIYTLVDHVGRRSNKQYHTPVLGQPSGHRFFIPLPYGANTDWCRNVMAAGGCTAHWNGHAYTLIHPCLVERAAGEAAYAPLLRFLLHAAGVHEYLLAEQAQGENLAEGR